MLNSGSKAKAVGKIIREGSIELSLPKQTDKISKEQSVFYNPAMRLNRDISVLVCKALKPKSFADPLCATGIRALRVKKESGIGRVKLNDYDRDAIEFAKKNAEDNGLECEFSNEDANIFLLNSTGFDYIDIDPFGSPNPFLQAAVLRASRGGILAVTATDTAPLCGTFSQACQRNYWARPLRTEIMHEVGLRILIRKCQLVATQFEKALIPIVSYSKEHYFRVFFKVIKGKEACDRVILEHSGLYFSTKTGEPLFDSTIDAGRKKKFSHDSFDRRYFDAVCGPLWSGKILDEKLLNELVYLSKDDENISGETRKLLLMLAGESKVSEYIFINLHHIVKRNKVHLKKTDAVISEIRMKGFLVEKSHFEDASIKTDMPYMEVLDLLRQ